MTTAPPLEYGRSITRRQRWARRGLIIAALLVAAAYPIWRWGSTAVSVAQLLYWQHRCLNYIPAKDQIAYEEDGAEAAKLLAIGTEYTAYPLNRTQNKNPAAAQIAAAFVPKCWTNFGRLAGPSYRPWAGAPYGAVVFLHELVSHGGNHRLVLVRYFAESNTFNPQFIAGYNYVTHQIVPATLRTPPVEASQRGYALSVVSTWPRVAPKVRMYCGEVDGKDSSHFTIRYEFWGKSDTLDGYLDDQDNVTLTPRQLPLDAQWSHAMGRDN